MSITIEGRHQGFSYTSADIRIKKLCHQQKTISSLDEKKSNPITT